MVKAADKAGKLYMVSQSRRWNTVHEQARQTVAGGADDFAVQADFAGGDFLEAGDAAQQRRLAAAGRAEQAGDLPAFKMEVDAIDDGVPAVALDDAI